MTNLTIFDIIKQLDIKQFSNNDEVIQKTFVPLLTQRWMTGTTDDSQIYIINEIVNPYIFSLHKHKLLLWNLLCCASSGKPKRYKWLKSNTSKDVNSITKMIQEYYNCSTKEAIDYKLLLSENDILDMATYLGKDKEYVTKITKEFKNV